MTRGDLMPLTIPSRRVALTLPPVTPLPLPLAAFILPWVGGSGGRGEVIRATAHAVLKNVFIAFYPLVRPQCQRVSSGRRSRYGSSDRAVRTVAACACDAARRNRPGELRLR